MGQQSNPFFYPSTISLAREITVIIYKILRLRLLVLLRELVRQILQDIPELCTRKSPMFGKVLFDSLISIEHITNPQTPQP